MNEVDKAKRFLIVFIIISLIAPGAYFAKEKMLENAGGDALEDQKIIASDEELNEIDDMAGGEVDCQTQPEGQPLSEDEPKEQTSSKGEAEVQTSSKGEAEVQTSPKGEAEVQTSQNNQEKSDEQKAPEHEATFGKAPKGYFEDALFIGDSRTVGLEEYGTFKSATFFCSTGMNVYDIKKDKIKVDGIGKVNLDDLLTQNQFGKVYVMLGINELGYSREQTVEKYGKLIRTIQEKQPDAIIYIQANLHVTKKKSGSDKVFNNKRINKFNKEIAKFADSEKIFYIDVNEYFDDKSGNLAKGKSFDEIHPLGKYYKNWSSWIRNHVVQEGSPQAEEQEQPQGQLQSETQEQLQGQQPETPEKSLQENPRKSTGRATAENSGTAVAGKPCE